MEELLDAIGGSGGTEEPGGNEPPSDPLLVPSISFAQNREIQDRVDPGVEPHQPFEDPFPRPR